MGLKHTRCFSSTCSKFNAVVASSFYDLKAKDIDGNLVDFSLFKKDLNILAFPSTEKEVTHEHTPPQYNVDSILRQPKEAQEDIKQVIHDTFKVMSPIHLNTINEHEVFAFLKEKAEELEKKIARHPEQFEGEDVSVIQMFTKFLVNRKGQVVARFGRDVEPDQMNVWIEQLLAEKP
ncbi:hypothetical protein FDP41_009437 [Naegleria fowleri]|uniref:Thioredoxin domain-containing protein n=1 Tax=Naegleria fowleri TaxID=5763 RepID=A0A6A5BEW1_NAEFO|nr:uncharacterized protein FDP41_009437 [Naegleria fowleri]KAF0972534.1 hypothetical protein FDP41_009437 [Naegleria fowleri]